MVRRRIAKEPTSQLAIWARRCALFSLAATVLVIVIVRAGWIELDPSLAAVTGALGIAGSRSCSRSAALVAIWRDGIEGLGPALLAIVIGALLLAYPAYLGARYIRTPAISDVTTDMTRSAAIRSGRALAAARHRRLSGCGRSRAPARRLSRYRAAADGDDSADRLRGGACRRQQAQVDGHPRPAAAGRTPRRADRGDRAHADPGLSRGRGGARSAAARMARASTCARRRATDSHDLGSNATRVRSLLEDIDDTVATLIEERKKPQAKTGAGQARRLSRPSDSGLRSRLDPRSPTRPRVTRSSRCASTERPAALVSRGLSPV